MLNDLKKLTTQALTGFFGRCFLQRSRCHVNKISLQSSIKNDNIPTVHFSLRYQGAGKRRMLQKSVTALVPLILNMSGVRICFGTRSWEG